ncbi:MAG: tRNA (guanosine(46)-N7)-methyltransferase TrmB [Alphaproteobacteria bacterium]
MLGRRTFYGRRQGRRLRAGLKALLDELLPQIAISLPQDGGKLDPAALFDGPRASYALEIGFGAGEHLAWQAERHPEIGFLGAEFFVNGVAGLLRRIQDRGLDNVRIYHGDARDLLDALPERSLDRAYILFPDPWPKTRHHKRRIVQDHTLVRLAQVMKGEVELRLATDDMDYLRWMLERLLRSPDFEWLAREPRDWRERPEDWPQTRYESKAIEQGRKPVYLRFRRRSREAQNGQDEGPGEA